MDQSVKEMIRYVRETSPYYATLYQGLPDNVSLDGLPLVDHAAFWAASNTDRRLVMTGPQVDGVIMKTGGTTNRPKTTAYSQVELQRSTHFLATGLLAGGVVPGDRIANMFYAGDLYGSFLLHVLSIMALPIPAVHVPIGGLTSIQDAADLIVQCEVTALLSTATSLVKLAAYITSRGLALNRVRCIMFGGEPLFPEQAKILHGAFPSASIRSCIYGTVDAGVLAHAVAGADTKVHRVLSDGVILEIVRNDGSGQVIEQEGEAGLLVATNLVRRLCPVVRYPTGDLAAWVDKSSGTFRLLGRAAQAVRLGPVSIDMTDLRTIVATILQGTAVHGIQAVLTREQGKDQMECMIAAKPANPAEASEKLAAELNRQRPMFKQHVELGLVAPLAVSFVEMDNLKLAPGSQKLLDVVEKRFACEVSDKA